MYSEEELLPLSGLQHAVYCERQWALIHIEQQWAENRLTAEGRQLHQKAHEPGDESRAGVRVSRGLALRSFRLGLSGKADVVEFRANETGGETPYPVEYKRGRPKPDDSDEVQLCGQALCLEEMVGSTIPAGAIFYGEPRRRLEIPFTAALRARTEALAARLHELYRQGQTPAVPYGPKCDRCSLLNVCLPSVAGARKPVRSYVARSMKHALTGDLEDLG